MTGSWLHRMQSWQYGPDALSASVVCPRVRSLHRAALPPRVVPALSLLKAAEDNRRTAVGKPTGGIATGDSDHTAEPSLWAARFNDARATVLQAAEIADNFGEKIAKITDAAK